MSIIFITKIEVMAILALVCQMQHVAMFKEYQNFTALWLVNSERALLSFSYLHSLFTFTTAWWKIMDNIHVGPGYT